MDFTTNRTERTEEIASVFRSSFTDSEGAAEGQLIGKLASELMTETQEDDIFVVSAMEDGRVVGSIIFTRLTYPEDDRTVFILAPVAVATSHQGKGIGQKLIRQGLNLLRGHGVDVVLTYGDINFYAKVGFALIDEDTAKSPFPLQYPEGWLGQSLKEPVIKPLNGECSCVSALNDPSYW